MKKRNVWRGISAASLIAAAVVTTAAPTDVEAATSSNLTTAKVELYNWKNSSVNPRTYYIAADGSLKTVTINTKSLAQYDTFAITASSASKVSTIDTIKLTLTNDSGATYKYHVNGQEVADISKIPHDKYEYEPGKLGTKIEVTVIPSADAPAGSKEKTYTFIVLKEVSAEAKLSAFTIASPNNHQFLAGEGSIKQTASGKTGFNTSVYDYNTVVNYNIDKLLVTPTLEGARAKAIYTVNGKELAATNQPFMLPLDVGNNIVTVTTIPETGDEASIKTYTFTIQRKANYNIESITSNELRMSGILRPTLTVLAGIIEDGIDKYTIDLKAQDATKQITVKQSGNVIAEGIGSVKATLDASNIVVSGTQNKSQNPVTITIGDENGSTNYTFDTWKRNPNAPNRTYAVLPAPGQFVNEHSQTTTGIPGAFGWGDGWDTVIYPTSANLSAEASGTPGLSLGSFGGFVTYQFDDPVKNDPEHPYGADFIVNGNGFTGNEEPGGVMVAQDKDQDGKPDKDAAGNEIWYELAGSEHYEDLTLWDYSVTYKNTVENFTPNIGVNVPWTDSLGRTGVIKANTFHKQIYFPMPENYQFEGNAANDMMGDEITYSGTNIQTLKTLFGYADVSSNNKGETLAQNPYTHASGGGGFMDIAWAVDEYGKPVHLDEVSFVKIYTNQQTDGGAVGEKSPEVLSLIRINDPEKSDGKTEAPVIKVNGQEVALTTEHDFTPVTVDSLENVQVDVESSAENVYINNQKVATRTYTTVPNKGIVRVIVQSGDLQPTIYTLHITDEATQNINDTAAQAVIDAISTLPATVTLSDREAVESVSAKYAALTAMQKTLVTNNEALEIAKATIVSLQIKEAVDAIAALPPNVTLTNAAAVETATANFEALTKEQQARVTNKDVLQKAQETIAALQAEKLANEAAAQVVIDAINTLPKDVTLTDAAAVQQVAEQYAALTEAQQAFVTNKDSLDQATATIAKLQAEQVANEAAAQAVSEKIAALLKDITLHDVTAVEEATVQYEQLNEVQQALVLNKAILDAAQATIAKLQEEKAVNEAAANVVIDAIAALPKPLTLNDAAAVKAVQEQYSALTDVQQSLVTNKDALDQAAVTITTLQEEHAANEAVAKTVIEAIAALPATITIAQLTAVQQVIEQYEALTEAQQALVTNKDVLDEAAETIAKLQAADEAAAKNVMEKIAALPKDITLSQMDAVQQAVDEYAALTKEQQVLVTNKNVLDQAQATITALQAEQAVNEAAAKIVTEAIAALPANVTLHNATDVQQVAAKFDALTTEQQALVTNKDVLDQAQATIQTLQAEQAANEAAAQAVVELILALPESVTLHDAAAIQQAVAKYAMLTDVQQALVPNKNVLDEAAAMIAKLQAEKEVNEAAAQVVIEAIEALPATITLQDVAVVEEATKQFETLLEVQKALVTNKATLEAAKATLTKLQAEKEINEAAAQNVMEAIAALPQLITLADVKVVEETAKKLLALTAVQQALVTNKDVLEAVQATIQMLQAEKEANEAAAKAVTEAIAALEDVVTLKDEANVTEAATKYAALTAVQQALVTNKDVLEAAKATIEKLKVEKATNEAAAKAVTEAIAALQTNITLADETSVNDVAAQYETLTEAQKTLVTNKALLAKAQATITALQAEQAANEAAAQAVIEAIATLPATITLQHEEVVQQVKVAYELLTTAQQALVANKDMLHQAQQALISLQTKAEQEAALQRENEAIAKGIMEEIAALPNALTLVDAKAVQNVAQKFERLTKAQQSFVTNQDVLQAAVMAIEELQAMQRADETAAAAVEEVIAALPVVLTLEHAEDVARAVAAFDALTAAQQALVTNQDELDEAKATIAKLQATQKANEAAAVAMMELIATLEGTLTLDDAIAVQQAVTNWQALTTIQQTLVTNKAVLDAAKATIAKLQAEQEANEAAAHEVMQVIAALPETITLQHAKAVTNAATKFDLLTEAQQALVTNKAVLDAAKDTIAQLIAAEQADAIAVKSMTEAIATLPAQVTLQHKATIEQLAAQFDTLTKQQQALVTNQDVLNVAKETIVKLQAEKEANEKAAMAVVHAIEALPKDITLHDATAVQQALTNWSALTIVQQALVTNKAVLDAAKLTITKLQAEHAANEAAAQAVIEAITAIPEQVTLDAASAVQDAVMKYNLLTKTQQAFVTNVDVMNVAKDIIAALQAEKLANEEAANKVIEAIASLPKYVTLNAQAAIETAATKFEALTETQQALVTNKAVLDEAKATIEKLQAEKAEAEAMQAANEKAAKAVAEQIAALPKEVTLNDASTVEEAEEKYEALTKEQQALVANRDVLDTAKATIAKLQAEKEAAEAIQAANEAAAKAVEEQIAALPTVVTLADEAAVQAASVQYELLTEEQKALVLNAGVLTKAKEAIAQLQTEAEKQAAKDQENAALAKAVEEVIAALPKELTLSDASTVEQAEAKYDALTKEQRALVPNKNVLDEAKATIEKLQAEKEAAELVQQANEAAAKAVEEVIAALTKDVTLNDVSAVEEAEAKYDALTKEQQALVRNKNVLDEAKEAIAQLQAEKAEAEAVQAANEKAAKAVEEVIAALPKEMSLNDAQAVEQAEAKYALLTKEQQILVPNKNVLDEAKETIAKLQAEKEATEAIQAANEAAAKAVEKLISELPKKVTLANETAIQAASVQYELLTEAQKELVRNADVLTKAKEAIAQLQTEAEQQAAKEKENAALAKAVEEVIAALPKDMSLNDAQAVEQAEAKYEALTKEQQALVPNKNVLDEAKATIAKLQAEQVTAQQENHNENVSSGVSNVPAYPAMPSMPAQPSQPETKPTQPTVKPPVDETPEAEKPVEVPEKQPGAPVEQPDETETPTEQPNETLAPEVIEVNPDKTIVTTTHNIALNFPTQAVGTVARVHVKDDAVKFDFAKENQQAILSQYVKVAIPQDVLSPKDGVLVQRLADGTVAAVPHRVDENGQFVLQLRAGGELFVQNTKKAFKDIAQDGHKQYIEELAERLIVNGTTAETFSPKATMTRGQFAAMLQRSLALPKTKASTFKDTADNQFAYELQTLVDIGVLKGDGDLLKPKDNITRKQAALMIARLLEHLEVDVPAVTADDATFTDKEAISPDALEAVALMKKLQIFSGKEDGRFDPNAPLTRSQMAKVLYQTLKYVDMM